MPLVPFLIGPQYVASSGFDLGKFALNVVGTKAVAAPFDQCRWFTLIYGALCIAELLVGFCRSREHRLMSFDRTEGRILLRTERWQRRRHSDCWHSKGR